MARVFLVMKTESYRAEDFIAAASRLGLELVVGSDQPGALDALSPGKTLALDFTAPRRATEAITAFHRQHPLDAIVAAEEEGTVLAARASAALGLSGNPEESVVSARDKGVFREIARAAGLPGPAFRRIALSADPESVAGQIAFPCVVKPVFLSASRGVIRADNAVEFVGAFRRVQALLTDPDLRAQGGPLADWLLVESYLPGPEVAVEGILRDGQFFPLVFFDKPDPLEGPFFEETIYLTPSRHPAQIQQKALAAVAAGAAALGLRNGPLHAELRLNGGNPALLELAPRSIGGRCSRALRFGAGMSLEEIILREALGMEGALAEREQAAAGVMMIPIPVGGTLHGVAGLAAARAVAGIEGVEIAIPLGREVVPLPEGRRYLGFIYGRGDSPAFVEDALRRAHGLLAFQIG